MASRPAQQLQLNRYERPDFFALAGYREAASAYSWQPVAKRALDLFGAVVGLVLLSPFMLLLGMAIRLESKGPALFRQERIGKGGVPFTFYKFRTMVDGNDSSVHREYVTSLITSGGTEDLRGDQGTYKLEHDPRVTRLGGLLRRTSMDELPQLINVFLGDMSLVGPRPPLPFEVDLYSARARRRLAGLPGMTGLWQVSGRCETTFDEMVELDLEYLARQSFGTDLMILARTIPAVLKKRGAC